MKQRIRNLLWRILGIDYRQALQIHDYVFLKNDAYTQLGIRTYDNGALVWRWTTAPLRIGNYCSIANNVRFIVDEGYHKASPLTSFPLIHNLFQEAQKLPSGVDKNTFIQKIEQRSGIQIGHDVWIGMGAYIMPGVTIGNGVTIAANAVVTKNIPDYTIAAGSPAKILRGKHDSNTIAKLNEIAWWNWEEVIIQNRVEDFYGPIADFIAKYG